MKCNKNKSCIWLLLGLTENLLKAFGENKIFDLKKKIVKLYCKKKQEEKI